MSAKDRVENIKDIKAYLGEDTVFSGTLTFNGVVRIDGRMDGEVHTDDTLIIGEKGRLEADIEDVIGRKNYVDLTRMAYNLDPDDMRPIERSGGSRVKVVEEVKDFMTSLPRGPGRFDRYRSAEFLIQQGADFSLPELDQALDRFEALFQDLNAMLN